MKEGRWGACVSTTRLGEKYGKLVGTATTSSPLLPPPAAAAAAAAAALLSTTPFSKLDLMQMKKLKHFGSF